MFILSFGPNPKWGMKKGKRKMKKGRKFE